MILILNECILRRLILVTVDQLERFGKYYLSDEDLSPDDLEYVVTNSPEIKRHCRGEKYDYRDYFKIYSVCQEIDNTSKSFSFSARYRCIKYEEKRYKDKYIDFSKTEFAPKGDSITHKIKVGNFTFGTDSASQYNFLILLLKWSDEKYRSGEFPIDNNIDAKPIFISQSIQDKLGIYVDIHTEIPFTVGYGEFCILDEYHVPPKHPANGGLCFYIGEYNESCISIEKTTPKYIMGPAPKISVFDSPYTRNNEYISSFSNESSYWFSNTKDLQILGNERLLKIYVLNSRLKKEIIEIHLFSKRDYYLAAAWLVVALSFFNYNLRDKYPRIREYWPTCPVLQDEYAKQSIQRKDNANKTTYYIKLLKPFYASIAEILREYTKVRKDKQNTQEQSLEACFSKECIALVDELSFAEFVPNGINLLNGLMNTSYKFKNFTDIIEGSNTKILSGVSNLIKTVYAFDIVAIAFEKLDQPIAQAIIYFYKLLGEACIDIGNNMHDRERFEKWLQTQQKYIDSFEKGDYAINDADTQKDIEDDLKHPFITITSTITSSSSSKESTVTIPRSNNTVSTINAREELDNLIGLESIKKDVVNLISLVKVQQMRKNKGLKSVPVSLHLVFTGNPGTGKTTVARILAQLYKEIGVLKKGQLVEVDRADLVAGYIGQTAIKTQEKITEAMGGILFIDEAYTLAKEGNDFGQEAIDTILKAMEDSRDEFIVIVAGYDEPMQKFINSNPGLKSRFNKYFHFSDYTSDELVEIFKNMIQKYDYSVTNEAMETVVKKIEDMESRKGSNFANARDVRNYFEQIITRQATRISSMSNPSDDEILRINKEDV